MLACGVPVAAIEPEAGVVLEDGTRIRARTVLCNADPKVALCACSRARTCPPTTASAWRTGRCAARWSSSTRRSTRCPTGPRRRARRGRRARRSTSPAASRTPSAPSRPASAASPPWASARSTSRPATTRRPRPRASHLLSVFGQYAPYELAEGTWDSRREEVARQFIDLIDRFAPGFEQRIEAYEVLGPPDIEQRIGLTGGNIFQGEVTPDQMWEHRLTPRTPVPGPLLLRRRDAPRRQRHRPQRPQRRHGGAGRRARAGGAMTRACSCGRGPSGSWARDDTRWSARRGSR